MKKKAQKQLEPISINQIKEILKKAVPDEFNKMIITENQPIKRGNYIYANFKYEKVKRETILLRFPMFKEIRESFTEFEGGKKKLGVKTVVNSEKLFNMLLNDYQIPEKYFDDNNIVEPFNYPLDTSNNEISKTQRKYFFPELTYQETCMECKGEGYVTCTEIECNGRHNWTCTECSGDGKIICSDCGGDGKITCNSCKGTGFVKCGTTIGSSLVSGLISSSIAGCNGKGFIYIDGGSYANGQPKPKREQKCSKCHGKGVVACKDCGSRGEIKCKKCSGRGEIQCSECSGKGDITCSVCYGDEEKYGKIDCADCKTTGKLGQIVYVNSFVNQNEVEQIFLKGDELSISQSNIKSHIKSNIQRQLIYKMLNNTIKEDYDEFSKDFSQVFEKELNLNKKEFPLVTKEEIYYQVVPCIELSYKHILTNTIHKFTIIDIWDNPEIIYHSEAEILKKGVENITKSVGGLFGKLFKTKGYKIKGDRKNEITLLIYLAKADGKIEEEEKLMLANEIKNLDDFTNSEKQKLFDLMNASRLPELTKKEITFSSKERGVEMLDRLTKLAMSDGEFDISEKLFIEKVKNLIEK